MYDIAIIGAGIVGCFLAHDLSKREGKVLLIDKESDVANQASMANSAIIHSGHDPKPGTWKARMNVRGNEMYEEVCKELGVSFRRTSAFVAATSKEEEAALDVLYRQAKERDIPARFLSGEEAREKEPNLSGSVTKVIELPSTGIVTPWELAIALAEEAVLNGVELRLLEEVVAIERIERGFSLLARKVGQRAGGERADDPVGRGERDANGAASQAASWAASREEDGGLGLERRYEAARVINAAGVHAAEVYGMVTDNDEFSIRPRRGEYFVLDKCKEPLVGRVIYPVPSEAGKGVLAVPTIHGNVLLGPNSEPVDGMEENRNTREQLDYVREEVQKTVSNIPMDKVIRNFAGLRPTGSGHDFVIEESGKVPGFVNVACIESPGIASAPAISEYVVNEILGDAIGPEKAEYKRRTPIVDVKGLSDEERERLVRERPAYGRIVCRCEQVTEGEIVDAIHRPVGARTVKGVKKRVRPGMGRCQGGFCEPLVVEILARELSISPLEVTLDRPASRLFAGEIPHAGEPGAGRDGGAAEESVRGDGADGSRAGRDGGAAEGTGK